MRFVTVSHLSAGPTEGLSSWWLKIGHRPTANSHVCSTISKVGSEDNKFV